MHRSRRPVLPRNLLQYRRKPTRMRTHAGYGYYGINLPQGQRAASAPKTSVHSVRPTDDMWKAEPPSLLAEATKDLRWPVVHSVHMALWNALK